MSLRSSFSQDKALKGFCACPEDLSVRHPVALLFPRHRQTGLFARAGSTAMGLFSRGDPASKSQHGSMSATLGAPHKASPSQGSRTLRSSSAARSGDDDASSAQQARSGAGGGSAQTTVGGRVRLGNEAERRKSNLAWSIVTQVRSSLPAFRIQGAAAWLEIFASRDMGGGRYISRVERAPPSEALVPMAVAIRWMFGA